ncbi:nucleolar protein 56-like protein [Phlyctochytrium arcticum]|nr:nucleolar protein 56-like protein [Phlyctochytrium arcticum]
MSRGVFCFWSYRSKRRFGQGLQHISCNRINAMSLLLLFETAGGYALFERIESEEIGQDLEEVQNSILELSRFSKIIKLKSFQPFKNAAHALENIMDVSEGICNPSLKAFLEMNMPKSSKKSKAQLGVSEPNLGGSIKAELGLDCIYDDLVRELIRGVRLHSERLIGQLREGDLDKAQLGLGHAYSRSKVKFNVNRADNHISQSINLLDQLDKDVNTFSMRVREWYGWHFPELVKIVNDNGQYAKLVKFIRNKSDLGNEQLEQLEEITGDPIKAKQIVEAARASMGTDISEIDLANIESFATRLIALTEYRARLHRYLISKMSKVAPNLAALIGEIVGARLIAHAGSLVNLCKLPASTVQILGAEKALFRALKTRGNTPKYGLIYHSTFIGRAAQKNKGRISRVLANKCSLACRIDCFSDAPNGKIGELLREQVEERIRFYEEGVTPRKNADVMAKAIELGMADLMEVDAEVEEKEDSEDEAAPEPETPKKRKKEKKAKEETEEKEEKKEKKAKKDKKEKKEKKEKKKAV